MAAVLTAREAAFLALRAAGASDRRVLGEIGLTLGEALRLGEQLRAKLGLAPGASLRDAGRAWLAAAEAA